ncbi:urea transporter [uncultured Rhodoblastus sp.]|uniref:urea transporter n=1 Tax=uncultured Rhodoblastus sp. TaxID=543037 RepID=UPI0025F740D4|nr:urea transporter [uncultured Rhodoblastus sp.]
MLDALLSLSRCYGAMLMAPPPAALLLLAATFVTPQVGLTGLFGAAGGWAAHRLLKFDGAPRDMDIFNAALVGLALATFRALSPRLFLLAILCGGLALVLAHLLRHVLPLAASARFLSLPAALAIWIALPVAAGGLMPPAVHAAPLFSTGCAPLDMALISFGAIIYSPNPISGAMVLVALLATSRILTLLSLGGYALSQTVLVVLTGDFVSPLRLSVGANAILVSAIVGGLYLAPRGARLFAPVFGVLVSTLAAIALAGLFSTVAMPALSLPFLASSFLCLAVFRPGSGVAYQALWLTSAALPEDSRIAEKLLTARGLQPESESLTLPFFGAMEVYQGVDGPHTHRGDWRHAVDFFSLVDGCAFRGEGLEVTDYHCFGREVLAPAAGVVVLAQGALPDHAPGAVDLVHVWGNHLVIATASGKYVLLAHLQQHSLGVDVGAWVAVGTPVARVGNSGRSPQPHLHMHVQSEAHPGAPTTPFHLSHLLLDAAPEMRAYRLDHVPRQGESLTSPCLAQNLDSALRLPVGRSLSFATGDALRPTFRIASEIGLLGEWRLVSDTGAQCALSHSPSLYALYDRQGPADAAFDGFMLALGLTPLIEDAAQWRDAPAACGFPRHGLRGFAVRLLPKICGNAESHYERRWDKTRRLWRQSGEHRLSFCGVTLSKATSVAMISECDGLVGLEVTIDGRPVVEMHLCEKGLIADFGIPAWSSGALASASDFLAA